MKSISLFSLMLFIFITGCAKDTTTPYYNRLAFDDIEGLSHDGYIVGIEKIQRNLISDSPVCNDTQNSCFDESRYKLLPSSTDGYIKKRNNLFKRITNDPKLMLVTHLFKYDQGSSYSIHNAYEGYSSPQEGPEVFQIKDSYDAFKTMASELKIRIESQAQSSRPYTHILLMSMGWNNDQEESILRYNLIVNMLEQERGDRAFRPIVIGVTWPSVWLSGSESWLMKNIGHISSVFNKANDADEIAYTLLGNLLYKHILPVKAQLNKKIPVVLIGHSYGARLISRTLFSDAHQKNIPQCNEDVDLMFGLQPAFSANRFIDGNGLEGSPFSNFNERRTRIILTTSKHDTANPLAFWSRHIGGTFGWNQANDYSQMSEQKVFYTTVWDKDMKEFKPSLPDTDNTGIHKLVVMVNAESIVKKDTDVGTRGELVSGHNDILDDEMAQLIWAGMDRIPTQSKVKDCEAM